MLKHYPLTWFSMFSWLREFDWYELNPCKRLPCYCV